MIKGIFVIEQFTEGYLDKALEIGADTIFTGYKNLDKELCRELQVAGTEIFAEVGLFAGEDLWEKFPDSRPVDSGGKPMDKEEWYVGVCPNHPGVRREKLAEIERLVEGENIDGVWLDFIRYPVHWEVPEPALVDYCYCENCLSKFRNDTGIDRPKDNKKQWVDWKCAQITDFVAEVRNMIERSGKDLSLGLFAVPWKNSDFDGAIRKIVAQDFRALSKYVDVFSPMTYHRMCGFPPGWIHETVDYFKKITGRQVLPLVQTENKPQSFSAAEFRAALEEATKESSQGVVVFFLENLMEQPKKLKTVHQLF